MYWCQDTSKVRINENPRGSGLSCNRSTTKGFTACDTNFSLTRLSFLVKRMVSKANGQISILYI